MLFLIANPENKKKIKDISAFFYPEIPKASKPKILSVFRLGNTNILAWELLRASVLVSIVIQTDRKNMPEIGFSSRIRHF